MKGTNKLLSSKLIVLLAVFVTLTCAIYVLLHIAVELMMKIDQYQRPQGDAVKVVSQSEETSLSIDRIMNHWKFFMEYGE